MDCLPSAHRAEKNRQARRLPAGRRAVRATQMCSGDSWPSELMTAIGMLGSGVVDSAAGDCRPICVDQTSAHGSWVCTVTGQVMTQRIPEGVTVSVVTLRHSM